jgi:hypothetical protein
VQFADGAASLGAPVALAGGVASLATVALAAGSHSITAAYSGDPGNQASVSAAWNQSVLAATTVSLTSFPASVVAGQPVTFTAAVSGSSPTGTVQFKDGGANLGAAVALSAGAAALSTNALITAGSHSITAVYSGDAANAAGTSPALLQTVAQAASTISIAASGTALDAGQSVTFSATVSGVAPIGTVQFTDGGANLGAAVALMAGTAALTTTGLAAGSHAIAAVYSGDANNLGSTTAAITVAVSAAAAGGDTDAPTLPEWAALILGTLLLLTIWRGGGAGATMPARPDLRPGAARRRARVPR